MKFVDIPKANGDTETVNAHHIIKMCIVEYKGDIFTRVILTAGGYMIDTPLTVSQIINRIKHEETV